MAVIDKPFAWSYSALNAFALCPWNLRQTRITKKYSDVNKYNAAGTDDHTYFERRGKSGTKLPPHLIKYEPPLARLLDLKGVKSFELELAITRDWQPTGWFSKDVWGRAKTDLGIVNAPQRLAYIFDWKFGKWRSDDRWLQLKVNAAFMEAHCRDAGTEIDMTHAGLVWVVPRFEIESFSLPKEQIPAAKAEIEEKVKRYEEAYEEDDFPKKQCFKCSRFCPVLDCQFNGRR